MARRHQIVARAVLIAAALATIAWLALLSAGALSLADRMREAVNR